MSHLQINKSKVNLQLLSGVCLGASVLVSGVYFLNPFAVDNSYAANTDVSVSYTASDWTISAPTSTAADAGLNFDLDPNSTGVNMAKKDTVTGGTTNVPNYQIYVSVNSEGGKIPATSGNSAIAATSGTSTAPAALGSNSWGYALSSFNSGINYDDLVSSSKSDSWSNSKWAKLPYVATDNLEDSSKVSTDAAKIYDSITGTGDSVDVYYAVNADNDLASGEYQTTVTYTLIGEMPKDTRSLDDFEYMQDVDANGTAADICENSTEWTSSNNKEYTLKDSRDNISYKIRKLKDGHCWMAQNFRMTADTLSANSHSTTLTSTDTDINGSTANFVMPSNASWSASSASAGKLTKGAADATKLPVGSSSGTKSSGEQAVARGAYYSWRTATADCSADPGTGKKQPSSICPKGWRLANPNNGSSTNDNEYYKLYNDSTSGYGGNYANFMQAFNTYYSSGVQYYLAGYWSASSSNQYVNSAGSNGYWWSSTSHSSNANYAWSLNANTSSVSPAYYNTRYYGLSVRCMF